MPEATPEAPPPLGGSFHCQVTVIVDVPGHEPFIGMPDMIDLNVDQLDRVVDITGPFPLANVMGPLGEDGIFSATGMGEVACFPDIQLTFDGCLGPGQFHGVYTMGAAGGLPQGEPISYQFDCPG